MFSLKGNCRTLAEFDLTDRLSSVSGREQNPPKILGGKLSTMGLEKSKSRGRVRKKGIRATCPFVNTALVLFLSSVPPRLSSLAHIVTLCPPTSCSLNITPCSFIPILYSESTFSQYRNRSRIGAWRCTIRRAGREIVLS